MKHPSRRIWKKLTAVDISSEREVYAGTSAGRLFTVTIE
jgi:hypothetical protein